MTGACDSEGTENGKCPTQYIDTTVDVPVAKRRREDTTETARRLHDEVQRNQDGQEAAFSIAQDREQEADCLRQRRSETVT